MVSRNVSDIYKQNQINTASPKDLVILLYEGCIKFLRLAELGLEEERLDLVNKNLLKAQDIISNLQVTLDMDAGGEISEQLEALYAHFLEELFQANMKKDVKKIIYVREKMEELLATWQEI